MSGCSSVLLFSLSSSFVYAMIYVMMADALVNGRMTMGELISKGGHELAFAPSKFLSPFCAVTLLVDTSKTVNLLRTLPIVPVTASRYLLILWYHTNRGSVTNAIELFILMLDSFQTSPEGSGTVGTAL